MPGPIIILTAIELEARAIRRVVAPDVTVHAIGIGALRLPDLANAAGVILAGLAGGLDPALRVGDVVLDDQSTWASDPAHPPRVRFAGASALVASVADKAELRQRTGAAVVEMEGPRVRVLCGAAGVPFLGLRAISDAASDAIDPAVLRFVDPFGRVRAAALAAGLVRRPGLLRQLRRLKRDASIALDALAAAVKNLRRSAGFIPPSPGLVPPSQNSTTTA